MDEVQTGQAEGVNQAGSPEHINEMLAKVDNGVQPDDVGQELTLETPTKPEWLPEKFSTPEDLVNAYNQLEQQYTQVSQQQEQEQATQEQVADIQSASVPQVSQMLDERGLDMNVFQQEYNETGELSEDAYKALAEAGIDHSVVDTWIQGQEALVEQNINQIYDAVGGQNNYDSMLRWANENLEQWEVDAFNNSIENLDPNAMFAVQGLMARMRNSEGIAPKLMTGESLPSTAPKFESLAQVTQAMKDPKYAEDPAYRASVAQMLSNSTVL
tara:strand:- start:1404 stop:2216 length:813 start_codon:yes stop_codon:yes gene_type:complete